MTLDRIKKPVKPIKPLEPKYNNGNHRFTITCEKDDCFVLTNSRPYSGLCTYHDAEWKRDSPEYVKWLEQCQIYQKALKTYKTECRKWRWQWIKDNVIFFWRRIK